jgi:hypothetical protein
MLSTKNFDQLLPLLVDGKGEYVFEERIFKYDFTRDGIVEIIENGISIKQNIDDSKVWGDQLLEKFDFILRLKFSEFKYEFHKNLVGLPEIKIEKYLRMVDKYLLEIKENLIWSIKDLEKDISPSKKNTKPNMPLSEYDADECYWLVIERFKICIELISEFQDNVLYPELNKIEPSDEKEEFKVAKGKDFFEFEKQTYQCLTNQQKFLLVHFLQRAELFPTVKHIDYKPFKIFLGLLLNISIASVHKDFQKIGNSLGKGKKTEQIKKDLNRILIVIEPMQLKIVEKLIRQELNSN